MRFPVVAIFFVIAAFIFLALWGVGSLLLTEMSDALGTIDEDLDSTYHDEITLLTNGFGIIAAIFFVCGILLVFVLEALEDEPEMYWRNR